MEQEKSTIAEEVIKKLETEKIEPIARWHFILRNSSFWTLWGVSVLIGSCAVSATIFVFLHSGWQYQSITHDGFLDFFLDVIPLFWIGSLIVMILFSYYNIRHTQRGYRFSVYLVIATSIVASFIGGTIIYTLGVGENIDNLRKPLPFSNPIVFVEEHRWNNDKRGLVSGIVRHFDSEKELLSLVIPSTGQDKIISTRELNDLDIKQFQYGAHIRIIGGFDENNMFVGCAVLPWEIPGVPYTPAQIQLPPPTERNILIKRTSICKDVRPYQRYKQIIITN